ncbi:MAG: hypothetical protein U5N26_10200 [Candidatus Marinimicrobia bacterium]|nr:hypothetical protein [Candidatus Neomarinimicrobiota bacterium]
MKINGQEIFNPQKLRLSRLLSRLGGTYFPPKNINRPVSKKEDTEDPGTGA